MNMIRALLLAVAAAASLVGPARAGVILTPGGAPGEPAGQHSVMPATSDGDVAVAFPGNAPFHHLFVDIGLRTDGAAEGSAILTVSLVGGHELSQTFPVNAGGRNFFTVAATEEDAIAAVRIASDLDIEAVDILRIGAVAGGDGGAAPVPEPAAIGLLGLGIVAIGWRGRSIRNRHRTG